MGSLLIVGLGNPGKKYEKTRHNLGFDVVRYLANHYGLSFKMIDKWEGELAEGSIGEKKFYLFLPMTYMNLSGRSVKKVVDYYKISLEENFLVVVDDIYVNFNKLRLRPEGGTGGHKGLKSLEEYLHSKHYPRLRLGIGPKPEAIELEDFVLDSFTTDERLKLDAFVARGAELLHCWLHEGLEKAQQLIGLEMNVRNKDGKKTTL